METNILKTNKQQLQWLQLYTEM